MGYLSGQWKLISMDIAKESIRREIQELRRELIRFEQRLRRVEREFSGYSRVDEIRNELKQEFPSLNFDEELLGLVGKLPYNPVEREGSYQRGRGMVVE